MSARVEVKTRYTKDIYSFLSEIDFKKIHVVDSLKFKGHPEPARKSWVSHVIVLYSIDRHTWLPIKNRYSEKLVNIMCKINSICFVNPRLPILRNIGS